MIREIRFIFHFSRRFFFHLVWKSWYQNMTSKWKVIFYFNFREKLCFTKFSTRICWNRSLAASGIFFLFAEWNQFYKFYWYMLRKSLFIKQTEWRMVTPFSRFYSKIWVGFNLKILFYNQEKKHRIFQKNCTRNYFQYSCTLEKWACFYVIIK